MKANKSLALLITLLLFTGCSTVGLINGSIYTDVKGPIGGDPAPATSQIVEGRATVQGILGFATGDCSIDAALKDALSKAPGSTSLKNITVDYHAKNILGIYAEFTTIVRGVAVK